MEFETPRAKDFEKAIYIPPPQQQVPHKQIPKSFGGQLGLLGTTVGEFAWILSGGPNRGGKRMRKKIGRGKRRSPTPNNELEKIANSILHEINKAYPNDERSRNIMKKYSSILIDTSKSNRLSTLVGFKEELDSISNKIITKMMMRGSTEKEAKNIVSENKIKVGILLDKIYDIVKDRVFKFKGEKMWIIHYIWDLNN